MNKRNYLRAVEFPASSPDLNENILQSFENKKELDIKHLNERQMKMESKIIEMKEKLTQMRYHATYGGYCGFILTSIINVYEDNEEKNWDVFASSLNFERRKNENMGLGLAELFKQPNHLILRGVIERCGWTIDEYDRLCTFYDGRNEYFHSGLKQVRDEQMKRNIAQDDLNTLMSSTDLPALMVSSKPVLEKALRTVVNDISIK